MLASGRRAGDPGTRRVGQRTGRARTAERRDASELTVTRRWACAITRSCRTHQSPFGHHHRSPSETCMARSRHHKVVRSHHWLPLDSLVTDSSVQGSTLPSLLNHCGRGQDIEGTGAISTKARRILELSKTLRSVQRRSFDPGVVAIGHRRVRAPWKSLDGAVRTWSDGVTSGSIDHLSMISAPPANRTTNRSRWGGRGTFSFGVSACSCRWHCCRRPRRGG